MTVRSEYGHALYLLAREIDGVERIKEDLTVAYTAIRDNPDFEKLLDTPAIPRDEKLALADGALGTLDECVLNLIKILSDKHSVSTLPDVYATYIALYNEDCGIEEVEAVTALPMTEEQLNALKARLDSVTGKNTVIRNTVDPSILGGVKLRYEGKQIDGSLKTRLDSFADALRDIVI
ncbi:MAG: ATP synthase F1 subunit delta [Clostridia bacterium]|nr:ATP synthase F1 subunit delta [Clostridia bacterium]